jgi:RES domain-containing protein
VSLPPQRLVRRNDTHRLIPSKYSEGGESVLARIADDDAHLKDIFDLDAATNDRLLAENNLLPGIGIHELVFGVPHYRIVNAAFCHAHPLGSRFNGPDRGAWYAAFELATSQAEVAFHKSIELAEVDWFDEEVTYDDYLADFSAELHDIRDQAGFADCLAPDSYVASQALAEQLIEAGALGVIYPSVRRKGGTCIGCFRPALVVNVRKGATYRFVWSGRPAPAISRI